MPGFRNDRLVAAGSPKSAQRVSLGYEARHCSVTPFCGTLLFKNAYVFAVDVSTFQSCPEFRWLHPGSFLTFAVRHLHNVGT